MVVGERVALAGLFVACALLGQETALGRLQRESARLRALPANKVNQFATLVAPLHSALRDWIESELPQTAGTSLRNLQYLETRLQLKLKEAGLTAPDLPAGGDGPEGPGLGYVGLEFQQLAELPDALFVVGGASIECGQDQAIDMYQFNAGGRTRILEDRFPGYMYANVQLSDPNSQGRRLLLTHYMSAQCVSTWMGMAYSVFRLGVQSRTRERLLSSKHGFWLGNDGPEFVLTPERLIIEFLDSSVDTGIHNRTQIHCYSFADGVHRLDPVALQPQDFVEEWLTRPWSEMESKSKEQTNEWHDRLSRDYVAADYDAVTPCPTSPGRWLIALNIRRLGDKELPRPLAIYFVLRDGGNYHHTMEAVSASIPSGCPGNGVTSDAGHASDRHPWLSTRELIALH